MLLQRTVTGGIALRVVGGALPLLVATGCERASESRATAVESNSPVAASTERSPSARTSAAKPSSTQAPDTPAPARPPSVIEAKAQPEAAPEPRRYVVAAVGDSLTDPRSHGGKYLDYLRRNCPESRFDAYGKGGEMVNQMRRRFAGDVLGAGIGEKPSYTHVIVFGGVNDLYSDLTAGRTVKKIASDLAAMYAAARESGLRVVAITVSPWGGFTRYFNDSRRAATLELNRWMVAQHQEGKIDHLVDAHSLLRCGDPDELCEEYAAPFRDGLHFGPAGHEKLGEALLHSVFSDCR